MLENPLKKQEFFPNHCKKCVYFSEWPIINYQEKKSQLIIFVNNESFKSENGSKNAQYEFIYSYLSFISNYNLNEANPLSFTINRNHQVIKNILKMKHKEDENKENNEFFSKAGESITIALLFQYTKEMVPYLKNYVENKSYKPLKFNENCISKNTFKKIINSLNIFSHFEEEDGKFKIKKIMSIENCLNQLIQDISEISGVEIFDPNYLEDYQSLQRTLYEQMKTFEEKKEVLISSIVLQALDLMRQWKNQQDPNEINLKLFGQIFEHTVNLMNYEATLADELKENFTTFVNFFNDIILKGLDGDFNSAMVFNGISYKDSLIFNIAINPAILAMSYTYSKMRKIKKINSEDLVYTDNNLPKITLILFEGYDDAINYSLVKTLRHLQIITIFFENEELHISEEIEENISDIEKSKFKKHFIDIPLRNRKIDPHTYDKGIKPEDILEIFEKIVLPLVSNYKPSMIVLTHTFIFSKTINNENKISLDAESFSILIGKLGVLCNYKMILIPILNVRAEHEKMLQEERQNRIPYQLLERYKNFFIYKYSFSFKTFNEISENRFFIYELLNAFLNTVAGIFFSFFIHFYF